MNFGGLISRLTKKGKKDKNADDVDTPDSPTYAVNFGHTFNRRGRSQSAAGNTKQEYVVKSPIQDPERDTSFAFEMKSESSHPSEVDYTPPPFSQSASICEMAITKRTVLSVRRHVAEKYETNYSKDLPILVRTAFTASANATSNSFDNVNQDLNSVMRSAQTTMRRTQEMAEMGDEAHEKAEEILRDTNLLKEDVSKLKKVPRGVSAFVVMFLLWILTLLSQIVKISRVAVRKVVGVSGEIDDDVSSDET